MTEPIEHTEMPKKSYKVVWAEDNALIVCECGNEVFLSENLTEVCACGKKYCYWCKIEEVEQ